MKVLTVRLEPTEKQKQLIETILKINLALFNRATILKKEYIDLFDKEIDKILTQTVKHLLPYNQEYIEQLEKNKKDGTITEKEYYEEINRFEADKKKDKEDAEKLFKETVKNEIDINFLYQKLILTDEDKVEIINKAFQDAKNKNQKNIDVPYFINSAVAKEIRRAKGYKKDYLDIPINEIIITPLDPIDTLVNANLATQNKKVNANRKAQYRTQQPHQHLAFKIRDAEIIQINNKTYITADPFKKPQRKLKHNRPVFNPIKIHIDQKYWKDKFNEKTISKTVTVKKTILNAKKAKYYAMITLETEQ